VFGKHLGFDKLNNFGRVKALFSIFHGQKKKAAGANLREKSSLNYH